MPSNPKCQDTFNTLTPLKKKKKKHLQPNSGMSLGLLLLQAPMCYTVLPDVISKRKDGLKLKILGKYIVQT